MSWSPNPFWGRGGAGRAKQVPSHSQLSLVTRPQSQRSRGDGGRSLVEKSPVLLPRQDKSGTTHPRAHRTSGRRKGENISLSHLTVPQAPSFSVPVSPSLTLPVSLPLVFSLSPVSSLCLAVSPCLFYISSISAEPFFLGTVNILEPCYPLTGVLSTYSPCCFWYPGNS